MKEAYKVIKRNRDSLGLNRIPIFNYKYSNQWYNHKHGFWCCNKLSQAKKLKKYMKNKYNVKTDIWLINYRNIIEETSCRKRVDRIYFNHIVREENGYE